MCIICNMPDGKDEVASRFLDAFARASQHMKAATEAMLLVSQTAGFEHRARYDAVHKEMVRQSREWNRLEQKRENCAPL